MLIAPKRLQLYDSKLDARISTVTADMNPCNFWKMGTDWVTPEIFKITLTILFIKYGCHLVQVNSTEWHFRHLIRIVFWCLAIQFIRRYLIMPISYISANVYTGYNLRRETCIQRGCKTKLDSVQNFRNKVGYRCSSDTELDSQKFKPTTV